MWMGWVTCVHGWHGPNIVVGGMGEVGSWNFGFGRKVGVDQS